MSFLMRKKSTAQLHGTATVDEPHINTTSSVVPKGSFSAPTFDRFLVADGTGWEGRDPFADRNGRPHGEGGLGRRLLSFPWGGKKHSTMHIDASLAPPPAAPGLSVPGSPTSLYSAISSPDSPTYDPIRNSTLAAFPVPPAVASASSPSAPKQHASACIAPHVAVCNSDSTSTFKSSSSFSSSNLFNSNTDEWESSSEATSMSISSSPESSSKDSTGQTKQQRMWRVKGLAESPPKHRNPRDGGLRVVEEEDEPDSRRNSTPVPRMVALMLADPETPPRRKSFSSACESRTSPSSPPLDVGYERMLRTLRGGATPSPPASPEGSRDADDEDDSPTQGAAAARLFQSTSFGSSGSLSGGALGPKTRIPSIRFEGISMDAVFAQVERNMKGSPKAAKEQKAARRRTRVLSMYRPMSFGDELAAAPVEATVAEEVEEPEAADIIDFTTISPSPSDLDALRCTSTTPTPTRPMDVPRPRPYPRRTSSRPAPLDVDAANSFPTLSSLATATSPTDTLASLASPPLSGAFSPRLDRGAPQDLFSPTLAPSPTLSSPKVAFPRLGEPFVPSPTPTSTSTFRSSPVIPEVCVCPPSFDDERDNTPVSPINQAAQPGPTKVVMLPQKRLVRASTRAAPKKAGERRTFMPAPLPPRNDDKENYTPPHSPALSSTSTIHHTPRSRPASIIDSRRLSSNSPLSVRHSDGEDTGSDCEETLHKLLMRLNRPHTPPTGASLTAHALQQHFREQLRPTSFDGPFITVTDTDLEHEEMERERERFEQEEEEAGWVSASTSAGSVVARKQTDESDDSRFSDAPLSIVIPRIRLSPAPIAVAAQVPLPLSPVVTSYPTVIESPVVVEESSPATPRAGRSGSDLEEEEELDPIEQEIMAALASIEESPSYSSFASSSSGNSFTSATSIRSSLAYVAGTPPRSRSSPRIPRSRTTSSDLASILSEATSATDSEMDGDGDSLFSSELGVVMMGQRVSCAYDVGVIGQAM